MKKIYMNPTLRVVPIRFNTILANSVPVGDDGNASEAEAREDGFFQGWLDDDDEE